MRRKTKWIWFVAIFGPLAYLFYRLYYFVLTPALSLNPTEWLVFSLLWGVYALLVLLYLTQVKVRHNPLVARGSLESRVALLASKAQSGIPLTEEDLRNACGDALVRSSMSIARSKKDRQLREEMRALVDRGMDQKKAKAAVLKRFNRAHPEGIDTFCIALVASTVTSRLKDPAFGPPYLEESVRAGELLVPRTFRESAVLGNTQELALKTLARRNPALIPATAEGLFGSSSVCVGSPEVVDVVAGPASKVTMDTYSPALQAFLVLGGLTSLAVLAVIVSNFLLSSVPFLGIFLLLLGAAGCIWVFVAFLRKKVEDTRVQRRNGWVAMGALAGLFVVSLIALALFIGYPNSKDTEIVVEPPPVEMVFTPIEHPVPSMNMTSSEGVYDQLHVPYEVLYARVLRIQEGLSQENGMANWPAELEAVRNEKQVLSAWLYGDKSNPALENSYMTQVLEDPSLSSAERQMLQNVASGYLQAFQSLEMVLSRLQDVYTLAESHQFIIDEALESQLQDMAPAINNSASDYNLTLVNIRGWWELYLAQSGYAGDLPELPVGLGSAVMSKLPEPQVVQVTPTPPASVQEPEPDQMVEVPADSDFDPEAERGGGGIASEEDANSQEGDPNWPYAP